MTSIQQPRGSAPPTVLVVEDEQMIARMVEEMLRDLGYSEIRHADTVQSALSSIDRSQPQVVVLDASLRGIAAYRVAQRLREAKIPFVVSTGFDPARLPIEFRSGVPLRKPYMLAGLEAALHQALQQRQ